MGSTQGFGGVGLAEVWDDLVIKSLFLFFHVFLVTFENLCFTIIFESPTY